MWPIKCAIKGFCYSLLLLLGSLHSGLHLKSLPVLLFCYPSCVVSGWTNRSSFATCRKTCLAHEIICVWLCSVLFCLVGCRFARFGYFVCYFGFVVFSGFSVCAGLYIHTVSVICFVDRSENLLGPVPFCSQGRGTGKGKGNAFTYRYAYVCVRPSSYFCITTWSKKHKEWFPWVRTRQICAGSECQKHNTLENFKKLFFWKLSVRMHTYIDKDMYV